MPINKPAFSYIRFSREHQSDGDSLRRQLDATRRYCERHGLVLDESQSLRDLGVSAFTGANVASGSLGRFLDAVATGRIPTGAALVVESLDRLSRQDPWKTISLLKQLKDQGIEIHLTMADMVLSPSEPDDGMKLMYAVTTAIRAHDESKTKSRRLIAAFAAKRVRAAQEKALVSKSVPWWLEIRGNRIVSIPARVKIVKQIFQMTAKGQSSSQIARALNQKAVPTWRPKAKQWASSRIRDLIRGDAALGSLSQTSKTTKAGRAHPTIPNYYPRIISDGIAAEARAAMRANRLVSVGRKASGDKPINIMRGLLRHKGRWMRFQPHRNGERDSKTGLRAYHGYYDVVDPDSPQSTHWGISAKQLEPVLIQGLRELKPEDLLPYPKKGPLRSTLLKAELHELERRRVNLLDAVEHGSKGARDRLIRIEGQVEAKQALLAEVETQETAFSTPSAVELSSIPHDLSNSEVRRCTAAAIRRIVTRIDVGGFVNELPWDDDLLRRIGSKLHLEGYGKMVSREISASFSDPVPLSKRRKPLWILVTLNGGARRLIARSSNGSGQIESYRIEADYVPGEHDSPLIV